MDQLTTEEQTSNGDYASVQAEAEALSAAEDAMGRSKRRLRLSMRAKLTLGLLAAVLPMLVLAIRLAWGTSELWTVWVYGLVSLGLGLMVITWAYQPLSDLAERARELAGVQAERLLLLGLVRADPSGDEALASALDRIEQNLHEIRALNRIGQLVASEEELPHILGAIAEEAVALLQADAGLIGTWDAKVGVFRDVAACNMPIMFPGREFSGRDCLASQASDREKVLFVEDYASYPYRIRELDRFRFRGAMAVPMMAGGECKGSLVLLSVDPDRVFTTRDGDVVATFASQAAAAFEKARLYRVALEQLEALTQAREQLAKESRELERALSNMVRVQEEERSRIAADMHDGVVQMMVGSLCELQAAMAHFPDEPWFVGAKQEKTRELIRDSITELRRVIFDLRPITLDTAGLVPAVENLVEDLQQVYAPRLEFHLDGTPCRFSPEVEIGVYRIIQEALHNALKHSDAASVEINTRFLNGMLQIRVSDDGKGFPLEEASSIYGKKAGLIGMRERARSLGGTLSISSVPGRGTLVTAEIPCRPRGPVYQHDGPARPAHPATPGGAGLELEKDSVVL
jgi:signal transduction histidine kinase